MIWIGDSMRIDFPLLHKNVARRSTGAMAGSQYVYTVRTYLV